MQKENVSKSVEVGFRITNLTATAILKGLETIRASLEKKQAEKPLGGKKTPKDPELKHDKQTLKQLHKHNEGLAPIELTDPNLRQLNKAMKKPTL